MLREAFSPPKPAWRVYAEINEAKQQKNEPTDTFITKKRSLFAQLTNEPAECDQIDMVFGLLHSQIRERVYRHKVKTFEELLTDAREAEQVINERGLVNTDIDSSGPQGGQKRCTFCRKKGHTVESCFKKQGAVAKATADAEAAVIKPKLACYGCNAPGYVRSNCPNCSQKPRKSPTMAVSFNSFGMCVGRDIPIVNVQLFSVPGQAYFDTGAKTSVASSNLRRIMEFKGCQFESIDCRTTLADGTTELRKLLTTTCKIIIGGRCLNIKFLIFPGDKNNRTLIGTDFLEQAQIVLNMGQQHWHFEGCPSQVFDFAEEMPLAMNMIETIKVAEIHPKRKATAVAAGHVEPKFLTPKRTCTNYVSEFESYGPDYRKESDYSPHSIQAIFKDAIPTDMVTPERAKDTRLDLFPSVSHKSQDSAEDPIFTPLNMFEYKILKDSDGVRLKVEAKLKMDELLVKHNKVFASSGDPTPYAIHKINTGDQDPIFSPPILKQAVDDMPFAIQTDASAYALGAVLLQGEGQAEHPIEHGSRLLNNAERNYSTTEREALAIVWACDKFRGYIEGSEVKLLTDHQPLKWLLSIKSPTGRLARWGLQIQQYNFSIEYLPGKINATADMLSRPPCTENEHDNQGNCICAFIVDMPNKGSSEIRNEQMKDDYLKDIIISLEEQDENALRWISRSYILNDGILYCYSNDDCDDAQLVIPVHERPDILKAYHDDSTAGHYGTERTIARIASRYFWPGMRSEITKYVGKCVDCQRFKATNLKPSGLLQTTSSKQRFEVVAVDLFGPLPQTEDGYRWILIVEDISSRWTELFKLIDATSEACAKILIEEVFLRYGVPRRVKSDNGVQFVSAIMQKVTYCLGIEQQFTPVYHPEANLVERKNRDLKYQLAIIVQEHHDNWHHCLPAIRFAMNSAKCQSTGYSASYLTFGREMRTLDDVQHDVRSIVESENFIPEISTYLKTIVNILKDAKETEIKIQDKNKTYVDQRRRPQPDFDIGTKVLVNCHVLSKASKGITSKFVPKRDGPYVITRKIGSSTFEVSSPENLNTPLGTYHASALTIYKGNNSADSPAPVNPLRKRGRPKKTK